MKMSVQGRREPVSYFLASDNQSLETYLSLDDSTVWNALSVYSEFPDRRVSDLAQRVRSRTLYKCVDIGVHAKPEENLYGRFRNALNRTSLEWKNEVLYDDASITPYKRYNFDDASVLNKILVKTRDDMAEPVDILRVSDIVKTLRDEKRIQRVYVSEQSHAEELEKILGGIV